MPGSKHLESHPGQHDSPGDLEGVQRNAELVEKPHANERRQKQDSQDSQRHLRRIAELRASRLAAFRFHKHRRTDSRVDQRKNGNDGLQMLLHESVLT